MNLVVLGGGGHGRVLLDALRLLGLSVSAVVQDGATTDVGLPQWSEEELSQLDPAVHSLVNGVGSVVPGGRRRVVFEEWSARGFTFATVVHPTAVVAEDALLGEGVQLMAAAVVQTGARLGRNTLVNTNASVDHDCAIGDHVHIAPGAVLSGGVHVGSGVHLGTGSAIIQGVTIGDDVHVGAGAVIVGDLPASTRVAAGARAGEPR